MEATKAASNCDEIVRYYDITFHEVNIPISMKACYKQVMLQGVAWMCMELMDLSLDKLYMIAHDILSVDIPEEILGAVAVAVSFFLIKSNFDKFQSKLQLNYVHFL